MVAQAGISSLSSRIGSRRELNYRREESRRYDVPVLVLFLAACFVLLGDRAVEKSRAWVNRE